MNTPLPKPTDPNQSKPQAKPAGSPPKAPVPQASPDLGKIGRSVAPTGVPKMEGVNPNLAPKEKELPKPGIDVKLQPAKVEQPAIKAPGIQLPKMGAATKPLKQPPAQPPTPGKTSTPQPTQAKVKKDPKKLILIIAAALIGIGVIGSLLASVFGKKDTSPVANSAQKPAATQPIKQTVLTYWGLWEPNTVLDEVINEYQTQNPGIKIDYRIQSHKDYRERLQTAIASGNGPDVFRYHSTWVRMMASELAVLPASVMTAADFKDTFYPSASQLLQIEGKIVGLPIMYDGLGLYYNKDILQTAGAQPPATWAELKKLASDLSVPADRDSRRGGKITRGGLAIGNTVNVEHFSDILALLILQNGGDPAEPAYTEVRDALIFYTNFIEEDAVWSSSLPSSTVAFATGDAAMMLAPSWRAHEVKELNPNLDFGIAPVPQLSDEHVAWANYWAEGVNEKGANKEESWNFLKYMTSAEVMKKLYSAQSNVRAFGEPYSRVDIAEELSEDPYVSGILKDASIAIGWFMSSATHDNGINDQIIEYYETAVNDLVAGEDEEDLLLELEGGVKQTLRQYGIE